MTANEWKAAGLDWQWLCEALARQGWARAAKANIRAAAANGVEVDAARAKAEFEKHESNRFD